MEMRLAIERLARDLGIPTGDAYTQDWAFEMPAAYRTDHWFDRYLKAFVRPDYGWYERQELLDLIFDIANQHLTVDATGGARRWHRVMSVVCPYLLLHRERVEYWACLDYTDDELGDAFALTPFVRRLLGDMGSGSTS